MAETPKNDIEKLLSDYAKQRRKDAGTPELHPATRRMLQAEVRREFPEPNAGTEANRDPWLVLWPRLAAACGVLVAVIAIFVVLNSGHQDSNPMTMAMSDESKAPAAALVELTPSSTAPTKSGELGSDRGSAVTRSVVKNEVSGSNSDDKDIATSQLADNTFMTLSAASTATMDTESPAPASGRIAMKGTAGEQVNAPSLVTAPSEPRIGAEREDRPAQSLYMAKTAPAGASAGNLALTQRFRNVAYVETAKPSSSSIVLNEFTVEQSGNKLKVVDGDGSVYDGFVQTAPIAVTNSSSLDSNAEPEDLAYGVRALPQDDSLSESGSADRLEANQQRVAGYFATQGQNINLGQNFFFRVEGTNRSLKQRVVFTGNIFNNTQIDTVQSDASSVQRFRQQDQRQQAPNFDALNQQLQYNNFINGRVLLGNGRQPTELNAQSVDR